MMGRIFAALLLIKLITWVDGYFLSALEKMKTLSHLLLASMVSNEKSTVILIVFPLSSLSAS